MAPTALHGLLHFLPEKPGSVLLYPETLGQPNTICTLPAGGYLIKHPKSLANAKFQLSKKGDWLVDSS
jgi:hypothetical protein